MVSTNYLYKKVVELSYTVTELYWRSALLASSFPLEVEVISILLASSSFHELEVSFSGIPCPSWAGSQLDWPLHSSMSWRSALLGPPSFSWAGGQLLLLTSSVSHEMEVRSTGLLCIPWDGSQLYWPPLSPMRWKSALLASSVSHEVEVRSTGLLCLPWGGGQVYWPPLSPMRWRSALLASSVSHEVEVSSSKILELVPGELIRNTEIRRSYMI